MSAVLFGSISTIADTSELQRSAFNKAFEQHGLGWNWNRDDYIASLASNGGQQRIADYAKSLDQTVDAEAVHKTKSEIFQKDLATSGVAPRPGVVETIKGAKDGGLKVALVTTTSKENIAALGEALNSELSFSDFDLIVDSTSVDQPKPDKAAYTFALDTLGEKPADCVAIEDNVGGVHAAVAAQVKCMAFPNENTSGHDFHEAGRIANRLGFEDVREFLASEQ